MKKAILLTVLFIFFFCSCGNQISRPAEQDYIDIINNTNTFVDEYDNEVFLTDYQIATLTEEYIFKPSSYTFIDLDGDSTKEAVVSEKTHNFYITFFKGNDDKIHGHSLSVRSMLDLKTDGEFMQASGAGLFSIAKITDFKNNKPTFKIISEIDEQNNVYKLNGKETKEDTEKYYLKFNKKQNTEWVAYSKNESTVDTSSISISKVRKALQIPDSADVTYEIGKPFYKESFGAYLAQVDFYENGELVAGASVYLNNNELGSNIMLYTPQNFNEESTEYEVNDNVCIKDRNEKILLNSDYFDTVQVRNVDNMPSVLLILTDEGKDLFATVTAEHIGETLDLCVGDEVISSPTVMDKITDGKASVTVESIEKAQAIVDKLKK